MPDRPPRPELRLNRSAVAASTPGRALMHRRDAVAAPLGWAPACGDSTVQRVLDNCLHSACALIGAHGGFIVVLRDDQGLDIAARHAMTAVAVLDATLGTAAAALHRALLDCRASTDAGCAVSIPMNVGAQTCGALCLLRDSDARRLGALDQEILDALAGQAALALAAGGHQLALDRLHRHLAPGQH